MTGRSVRTTSVRLSHNLSLPLSFGQRSDSNPLSIVRGDCTEQAHLGRWGLVGGSRIRQAVAGMFYGLPVPGASLFPISNTSSKQTLRDEGRRHGLIFIPVLPRGTDKS
ncbi:hypothetical protein FA13DRAFT_1736350 [Coprinellus micaceus]|uniref:Uncharacterized protein n=1 Tax=Coprinellus micaceus TaxID=71717 RepID=A0A4Y7T0P7_COPMI|nr:hypothetical protein FA13DRAFT_1736350 [Coprinellus micaceus]